MKPGNKVTIYGAVFASAFILLMPGGLLVFGIWTLVKRWRVKP